MGSKSISSLVNEQCVSVAGTTTVDEAIDEIRTQTPGTDRTVYYVYVVDGGLAGVVSLRELLNAGGDVAVSEIMTKETVTVSSSDSAASVAETFSQNSFNVLPVVDGNEFKGVVSANDVLDVLDEDTREEIVGKGHAFSPFGD